MTAPFKAVLIANRGEIAIRIARAAQELGIRAVAVHARDDSQALHVRRADEALALDGDGVAAYLDPSQLIRLAKAHGCDALHPGYGFLAENASFAAACEEAGIAFIGPTAATLEALGDKSRARQLAATHRVPLLPGTPSAVDLPGAQAFMESLPQGTPVMIKALAGGGGRGMRIVHEPGALAEAFERCRSEAQAAFGQGDVYVEQLLEKARHIEVQVLGDGQGQVSHLWERDCSLQRRHQKLIEVAPAQQLPETVRDGMIESALTLARALDYRGIGTFEFLLSPAASGKTPQHWFMEANPRLQVEHTITETITGVDLVKTQFRIASGERLETLGLTSPPPPRGCAIQLRLNAETLREDGQAMPASGVLSLCELPSGPGLRVDTCAFQGFRANPRYDSLLAKLIVQGDDYRGALERGRRALLETRLEGLDSNRGLLHALLTHPEVASGVVDTHFVSREMPRLMANALPEPEVTATESSVETAEAAREHQPPCPHDCERVPSRTSGVVVALMVEEGDTVQPGQTLAIVEAMKMEFEVSTVTGGTLVHCLTRQGESVREGDTLFHLRPDEQLQQETLPEEALELDDIRSDLAEVRERHAYTLDEARPEAMKKRKNKGLRSARENLDDLLDPDSALEYGALALAAQRRRRPLQDLIEQAPADGLIAMTGTVNAHLFGPEASRCMALAYDYTVFAGTQGVMNHKKTDRMLQLAAQWSMPLVFFTEGGGGRPGDSDYMGVSGLDCHTFAAMAALSGQVPLVGVAAGRCFAGNAALLGCCDVIIATRDSTLGMAGPAMIEGGGLGRYSPEQVGPLSTQAPNGVIDLVADDEAQATAMARQYLGYFQGRLEHWELEDQRHLRHRIPENRLRVYDVRALIRTLVDRDSLMELRAAFAPGMVTALARIEGRPVGLIANDPAHLGGAIDADCADKAARFMQLCNAFGLPIVSLCDTPGFMVGPEAEQQATIRHVSRLFVVAAKLQVPFMTVVLRKGYGLGAQAMAAGSFHSPLFTIAWPSGEFGAMGLEGAVRLGYARELAAVEDPQQREALFNKMVARAYENGKGINTASFLEIDAVIDPAETRDWLVRGLNSAGTTAPSSTRGFIDTW
ncbi:MAG: carboxyl transferase domain-containing protein [Oleiphilaceae bacterium]|nr:carboxyl transferase domain-containing protein [Oleiphilaceae bacterium]